LLGEKRTSSVRPREAIASVTLGGAVYSMSGTIHGPRREFKADDVKRSKWWPVLAAYGCCDPSRSTTD